LRSNPRVSECWAGGYPREVGRLVLIDRNSALASLLDEDQGWHKEYEDRVAIVFVRETRGD